MAIEDLLLLLACPAGCDRPSEHGWGTQGQGQGMPGGAPLQFRSLGRLEALRGQQPITHLRRVNGSFHSSMRQQHTFWWRRFISVAISFTKSILFCNVGWLMALIATGTDLFITPL